MAELLLSYLMDKFAAYDMQYKEELYPYVTEYEYINSMLMNTRMFDNILFCSLNPYSYQKHANSTPIYKSLREAKEQGKPAFASFNRTINSQVAEGVKVDSNINIANINDIEDIRVIRTHTTRLNDQMILDKIKDANVDEDIKLANNKLTDTNISDTPLHLGIRKDIQSEEGMMLLDMRSRHTDISTPPVVLDFIKKAWLDEVMFLKNNTFKDTSDKSDAIYVKRLNDLQNLDLNAPSVAKRSAYGALEGKVQSLFKRLYGTDVNSDKSLAKYINSADDGDFTALSKDEFKKTNVIETKALKAHEKLAYINEEHKRIDNITNALFIDFYSDLAAKSEYIRGLTTQEGKTLDTSIKYLYKNSFEFTEKNYNKDYKNTGDYEVHFDLANINKSVSVDDDMTRFDSTYFNANINSMGDYVTKYVKDPKGSWDAKNYISVSKGLNKEAFIKDLMAILVKEAKALTKPEYNVTIFAKDKYDTRINSTETIFAKDRKDTMLLINSMWLYKKTFCNTNNNHVITEEIISFIKKEQELSEAIKDVDIEKVRHLITYALDEISADKDGRDMVEGEGLSADKNGRNTRYNENEISLYKVLKVLNENETFSPIYKGYIDTTDMAYDVGLLTNMKDTFTQDDISFDKSGCGAQIDSDIFIDKYYRPVNLNVDDSFVSKRENLIGLSAKMIEVDSVAKDINCVGYIISISSVVKDIDTLNDVLVDAVVKDIRLQDKTVSIDGYIKSTEVEDNTIEVDNVVRTVNPQESTVEIDSVNKNIAIDSDNVLFDSIVKSTVIQNDWECVKNEKDTRIEQDVVVDKQDLDLDINKDIPHIEIIKVMQSQDRMIIIDKAGRELMNDKSRLNYLVDKNFLDTNIEITKYVEMQKVLKDLYYDRMDEWVYDATEHDDMDLTAEGIDELLLPQQDFDYEKFKADLVDPVTLAPINPVKQFPDGSFIATRPANHPLPEFKDIAKQYLDVDVSLLRHMIHIFNKTWQMNIFKFGAMDMRDSVGKMLEFMDAYINLEIPTPLIPQAQRILRLMRWYGEASILKHAEYKIKYTYDPLKSDLFTGTCKIPNTMDNMMVDTTKYTIKNVITGSDAWVEFEIENPVPTKISFTSYITDGELSIFINGVLIDTVTVSPFKAEYDLVKPPAGDKNKVKLFYHSDNNGIINIANVVISDMFYSDLTTEYSPKVGSGNKVLDDFVKRIAVYADLYQNNANFMEDTINGNLAITDLVDKLQTYFELHHEKKRKGKRKTIKKS